MSDPFSVKEATKIRDKQSTLSPKLTNQPPFTIDTIFSFLGRTVFSSLGVALLPVLAYRFDRNLGNKLFALAQNGRYPSLLSFKTLTHLLVKAYPGIGVLWTIGAVRLVSRTLSRYVDNLGEWKRDRPNWENEVVVITGGSRGIGAKVVEILSHRNKARIAVLDVIEPEYALPPRGAPPIHYYPVDVSNSDQVARAARSIRSSLGEPTILINNAGIFNATTLMTSDASSIERAWRVNTLSHFVTVKEFLPHMIKQNHGHILSLASSASFMSLPQMGAYTTSKTSALAFFEVLRGELRSRYFAPRVRTSICCPTKVRTMMGNSMEDHKMSFLHPNLMPLDVAWDIVDALESGLSQYLVKPKLMVVLPLLRGVPSWLKRFGEVVTHSDHIVNDSSIRRAMQDGYGSDWKGADADSRRKLWG
ncbi:unnamed protein product [Sympodiomycopsis kandeliae]